ATLRDLHSFPTRRSSDLRPGGEPVDPRGRRRSGSERQLRDRIQRERRRERAVADPEPDRRSPPLRDEMIGGDNLTTLNGFSQIRSEEHTSELQSLAYLVC